MKRFLNWFYRLFDRKRCKRKFDPHDFAGAGNVNWWAHSDIRKETRKLAKAGIPCYHFELFGWADSQAYDKVGELQKKLKELLFWCKRRKLRLFVSVINDNAHLSKYGNTPIKILNHKDAVLKVMVTLARASRKQEIYIQPSGETQTPAGKWVEAEAANLFIPERLVYNGDGGRPKSIPGWARFRAWHKGKQGDGVPAHAWDVTDHGTLLNWLGGTGAQVYNNDNIKLWASTAKARGNPAVLYMFQQRRMDESNLKTLAKAYYGD